MPPTAETEDDPAARYRYRMRFTKSGQAVFLGHLDTVRTMLRALRRYYRVS